MITPTLVHLSLIDDNPYQPRLSYDEAAIAETAASIKANGLLQIPTARQVGERYQLAFGHRRRRAYSLLAETDPAYAQMPLIIRELDDRAMVKQTWSENKDRRDISPYEEARAIDHYMRAFGWSHKQVAEELGIDRSTVTNKVGLLKLPAELLRLFAGGELSERQMMALKPLAELPINSWDTPISCWVRGNKISALSEIVPLISKIPADELRRIVDDLLDKVSVSLEKVSWPWQAPLPVDGVQNQNCKECAIRMRVSNRCPSLLCAELKEKAARRIAAAAAAAKEGLPADAVGGYGEYDTLSGVKRSDIKKEAKYRSCSNLVVAKVSYGAHPVEGHTGYSMVCKSTRCQCKAALEKSADPAKSDAARKKADRKQIRQMYKEPAEAALAGALADVPAGMLRLMLRRMHYSASQKLAPDASAATIATAIAEQLVREEIKYDEDAGRLDDSRQKLEQMLTLAGIELPWKNQPQPEADDQLFHLLEDQVSQVRKLLADAHELRELPIAPAYLEQAEQRCATIATINLNVAEAYQRQIETLRNSLQPASPETESADGDVCAQTPALTPLESGEPIPFPMLKDWVIELRNRITTGEKGAAIEQSIEILGDHLQLLTDDEGVSDEEYEQVLRDIDDLVDMIGGR
ncbi:ParB/RepB/Spo0J family partition protein [Oscillochloris sp. ZM17-4]|uniref:ParB/RepB/Spo0J family partition protein n=1 Tax=Oscillochloris sp. ZM17-4 TaxID=2866714 RepID=UPI001C72E3A6|nr:ParB/RepB/Spo0J family partition protein [Oscillochloris sp. ZM17-4]MBX0326951.1 ParB/RepB/Spo0J family partition protein [Oscillochloris sp. ZM17-4]